MKKKILSFVLAIAMILPNFIGVPTLFTDLFKNLFTIPAEAAVSYNGTSNEPADYAYSFAVIGDTQKLLWNDLASINDDDTSNDTQDFVGMYDWIVTNKTSKKIACVMGLGDITDANTGSYNDVIFDGDTANTNEYLYAKSGIDKLSEAEIPYTLVRGNHDKPHNDSSTEYTFNKYFKYDEYASHYASNQVGRYDGKYEDGTMHNTYLKIEVEETKYLILNLDCGISSHKEKAEDIIKWANEIVSANKEHKVIITTHMYLNYKGAFYEHPNKQFEFYGLYSGQYIWDNLVKKHENIFLVLSGHNGNNNIGFSQSTGDNGNTVTQFMINPQTIDVNKNAGLVGMLYFQTDGKVNFEYYSTVNNGVASVTNATKTFNISALNRTVEAPACNHTYSGNCDEICDICFKQGRTVTNPQHTWSNACDHECNVCRATREKSHAYDNDHDATCNNGCGTVRVAPHYYKDSSCSSCARPTCNNFYYTVSDGKATITGYEGTPSGSITIPDRIYDYNVTVIGSHAFDGCTGITSINIPQYVERIEAYAFSGCTQLATVTNNSSQLKTIEGLAFYGCIKLTGITIPDTLCYIGEFAFYGCNNLSSITIPANLTVIERYTFTACTALSSVNLPDTVHSIQQYAFDRCAALKKITIPDSVTKIGSHAFSRCTALNSIIMSMSLEEIGNLAFWNCTALTEIYFPRTLKNVGKTIFIGCESILKTVWYEGTNTDRENIVFSQEITNDTHTNAFITNGTVTWNYNSCMKNTESDSSGNRPHTSDNKWIIDKDANCEEAGSKHTECTLCSTTLSTQIIPATGAHVYNSCEDTSCENCDYIRDDAGHKYDNCEDNDCNICHETRVAPGHKYATVCDAKCSVCQESRSEVPHVTSSNCDTICNSCGATINATEEHTFDDELDPECNICDSPRDYSDIFEYTINNNTVTITEYKGSSTDIVIPSYIEGYPVKVIGTKAFYRYGYDSTNKNSRPLTSLTIGDGIEIIEESAFEVTDSTCKGSNIPQFTTLHIPDSVTTIGNRAFFRWDCLENLTGCKNVTTIGTSAFEQANSGTRNNQSLPEFNSLITISNQAFFSWRGLKELIIPDSVTSIGDEAFFKCRTLESLHIGKNLTSIGDTAFGDIRNLTSITVDPQNTTIKYDNYCLINDSTDTLLTALGNQAILTVPQGVTVIDNYALSGHSKLTTLILPDGLTSIGSYALYYSTAFTTIVIPDSVTTIENNAFDTTKTSTVYYEGTVLSNISITSTGNNLLTNSTVYTNACMGLTSYSTNNYTHTRTSDCDVTCNTCRKTIAQINNADHSYANELDPFCTVCGEYARATDYYKDYFEYNDTASGDGTITITKYIGTDLTQLNIPSHIDGKPVTVIGASVFNNKSTIIKITIPDTVVKVGASAFYKMTNLEELTIGANITTIGNLAFGYMPNLTSLSLTTGGNTVLKEENGCLVNTATKTVMVGIQQEKIVIPNGVEVIGDYAFYGPGTCQGNIRTIIVSNGVKRIERCAFDQTKLSLLVLPDTLEYIGYAVAANTPLHKTKATTYNVELGKVYFEGTEAQYKEMWDSCNDSTTANNALKYNANSPKYYNACIHRDSYEGTDDTSGYGHKFGGDCDTTCNNSNINGSCSFEQTAEALHGELGWNKINGNQQNPPVYVCPNCNDVFATFKFSAASITLQEKLAINYKVDKNNLEKVGLIIEKVVFTFNEKTYIVEVDGEGYSFDEEKGIATFTFKNIAPDQMTENLSATLYAKNGDTDMTVTMAEYSIADYCYKKLRNEDNASNLQLLTLLVDTLNYGSMAQIYNNSTETLANANLTDTEKELGSTEYDEITNETTQRGTANGVTWEAATLILKDTVTMKFKFKAEDVNGLTVKIKVGENDEYEADFQKYKGNVYQIVSNPLTALQMREDVKVTVYRDGEVASPTLTYSIGAYVARKNNDATAETNLKNLIKAMMIYGDSAVEYKNKISAN